LGGGAGKGKLTAVAAQREPGAGAQISQGCGGSNSHFDVDFVGPERLHTDPVSCEPI